MTEAPDLRRTGPLVVDSSGWILREHGEGQAIQAVALMQRGRVVDLGADLALRAAQLGLEHRLPLADSVILATACAHGACLLTMDCDLQGLRDGELVPREGADTTCGGA